MRVTECSTKKISGERGPQSQHASSLFSFVPVSGVSFRVDKIYDLSLSAPRYGLADYGISLAEDEFEMVMSKFDSNRDGFVSFDEFLRAIRGPMSSRRKELVGQAYRLLDAVGEPYIPYIHPLSTR